MFLILFDLRNIIIGCEKDSSTLDSQRHPDNLEVFIPENIYLHFPSTYLYIWHLSYFYFQCIFLNRCVA